MFEEQLASLTLCRALRLLVSLVQGHLETWLSPGAKELSGCWGLEIVRDHPECAPGRGPRQYLQGTDTCHLVSPGRELMNIHIRWSMREPAEHCWVSLERSCFPVTAETAWESDVAQTGRGEGQPAAAQGECVFLHPSTGVPGGSRTPGTKACLIVAVTPKDRWFTIPGLVSLCACCGDESCFSFIL